MLLVALEEFQAGLQQAFELGIVRRGDKRAFERTVDGLMVGNLVVDICLVECRAFELRELGALGCSLLGQRAAGLVILRLHVQLLDQCKRLLVHRGVVAHHVVGERAHFLVLGFVESLLGRLDVKLAGRVGNVRNLRIGGLRALRKGGHSQQAQREHACRQPGNHGNLPFVDRAPFDAAERGRFPEIQAPQIRWTIVSVMRSQRRPSKGKLLVSAGPSCLSSSARNSTRARCSRVFTVSGCKPKRSAVSSTLMPSTMRATNTERNASGSSSIACSSTVRISLCAIAFSGSLPAAETGKLMISASLRVLPYVSQSTVGRRFRNRPSASFMAMRVIQVPKAASPRNMSRPVKARTYVSCTTSSASASLRRMLRAIRNSRRL